MTAKEQLGWCGSLADAAKVRDAGYDYLELPLAAFGLEDDASLAAAKKAVSAAPLPVPVFSRFYPADFRAVGEGVDRPRIQSYLKRAAELMHHAGARVAVLGSAWSRNVPPGFSRARAREQILESYGWVADALAGSGVLAAIEAQNRKEANIITTLAEAVDYARALDRPEALAVIADFYHMEEEQEPLNDLVRFGEWIAHVQLADSNRLNPGTGSFDYYGFFGALRSGGYRGRVSVECMVPVPDQGMRDSQIFLRQFWPEKVSRE
jgi:sugar phosphate isomerase/epimerase